MMAADDVGLGAALLLGFVGSVHCLGMCGGIAGALGQSLPPGTPTATGLRSSLYSLGRISSYAMAGALVGALGHAFATASGIGLSLRIAAGLLIGLIGLHVGGWWNGMAFVERAGLGVWRRILPLARRLGRPDRAWKIFATGLLWGWLPCGLVYSALVAASATGTARSGALFMFCFGLGTLPALVFASGLASTLGGLARGAATRKGAGILLVIFGLWTVYGALGPVLGASSGHAPGHDAHGAHGAHDAHEAPALAPAAVGSGHDGGGASFTISTLQGTRRAVRSATLPSTRWARPWWARVPITSRSAPSASTTSAIALAGIPSSRWDVTRPPRASTLRASSASRLRAASRTSCRMDSGRVSLYQG